MTPIRGTHSTTRILLAAVLLALLGGGLTARPARTQTDSQVYLPVILTPLVYTGHLLDNGEPVAGETVILTFLPGAGQPEQTVATTQTAADGSFIFSGFPALTHADQALNAVFTNASDRPDWLGMFTCDQATLANPDFNCEINVHNVTMLNPGDRVTTPRITTFAWAPRQTTSDDYEFFVSDGTTGVILVVESLGYTNAYTLDLTDVNLTAEFYWWRVDVTVHGEGRGVGFYAEPDFGRVVRFGS